MCTNRLASHRPTRAFVSHSTTLTPKPCESYEPSLIRALTHTSPHSYEPSLIRALTHTSPHSYEPSTMPHPLMPHPLMPHALRFQESSRHATRLGSGLGLGAAPQPVPSPQPAPPLPLPPPSCRDPHLLPGRVPLAAWAGTPPGSKWVPLTSRPRPPPHRVLTRCGPDVSRRRGTGMMPTASVAQAEEAMRMRTSSRRVTSPRGTSWTPSMNSRRCTLAAA